MVNWESIGICLYVLAMIGIGFYFSRRIKTDDDYFLAGRSLGPGLATFSIFATWFGAETCIGTAGAVYRNGLSSAHADPIGYAFCLVIVGVFFAKALWNQQITTIPDLFRKRYSPRAEKLAALIMIPSSIIWAGAQVRALGQIIQATTDFGPITAITVAATVVIVYTMCGGMLADAYADLIQGIAIIFGLVFLVSAVIMKMGGPEAALQMIPKDKLTFGGGEMAHLGFMSRLEIWLVPIFGSVMSQELVSRVVASRSPRIAHQSALRAAFIYFVVGSIPVLIGLLGINYIPGLEESEALMPVLAKTHLNYFFYIIFVGALVSAILSTVDTTLLASSALLSHNLIYSFYPKITEKRKLLTARGCTLAVGLISYSIAYSSESITGLVELASSLGGPTILVLTIAALWDERGTASNAIIAMVMSIVSWGVAHFLYPIEFPVLATVSVCVLSYLGSLLFTRQVAQEKGELVPNLSE